jgi:hypothetical protein
LGKVYSIQDDFHRAKKEFEKTSLTSNYMEAYNALGFTMEALGDDAAALESTKQLSVSTRSATATWHLHQFGGYYNRRAS